MFEKRSHKRSDTPWASKWRTIFGLRPRSGGQGTVTFVESAGRRVRGALKVLKIGSTNTGRIKRSRARMRREVVALETLKGTRGIPKVLDHNTDCFEDLSTQLYVVQEFVDGITLAEHAQRPLSISEAARITIELCELLKACHDAGVLHRDIKPDNIIIDSSGSAWLVDFGLTYIEEDESFKTDTREEIGNRFLRLPEHSSGRDAKHLRQSDVTQACGILFKLITGYNPSTLLDDEGLPPHLSRHSPVAESTKSDPRWPKIKSIFDIGFSVDINLRFLTAEELLRSLKEIDIPTQLIAPAVSGTMDLEHKKLLALINTERSKLLESVKQVSRELHQGLNTLANERNLSPRLTGHGTQLMNSAMVLGFQLSERNDSDLNAPLVHYIRIVGANSELVEASYAISYERTPQVYPEPYYQGRLADIESLRAAVSRQQQIIFTDVLRELNRLLEAEGAK